jgi:hypothetical protein
VGEDARVFTVTFSNPTTLPLTFTQESLVLEWTIKRDGKKVVPIPNISTGTPPAYAGAKVLITVAPGDSASVPVSLSLRTAYGQPCCPLGYGFDRRLGLVSQLYDVTLPGTYKVRVKYKYTGRDAGAPNVYRKSLTSNWLMFTVQ